MIDLRKSRTFSGPTCGLAAAAHDHAADGAPSVATDSRKCQRRFNDTCHCCVDFGAEPGAARFVPAMGLERFGLGLRPEKRRTRHPFFNSLRRTSDHGIADPG